MLLEDFKKNLNQDAALILNGLGFIAKPFLLKVEDDQGIFEGMFYYFQNNYDLYSLSKQKSELYLRTIASYLFGVGVYIGICQKEYSKGVDEFQEKEMYKIKNALINVDTYKLGIKALGIDGSSKERKRVDKVVALIEESAKRYYPSVDKDLIYLKECLKTYYYVGITLATYK